MRQTAGLVWIALIAAGLLEVVWAFAMKRSDGFTQFWPTLVTLVAMAGSVGLLAWSMRALPRACSEKVGRLFRVGHAPLD